MAFLTEPEPPRGVPLDVLPGIRRIVARNPSVMTYHGTNTYLIEGKNGVTVLDPGPDDEQHVTEILAAVPAGSISNIVLTHTHGDHMGATAALKAATGAAVSSYKRSPKANYTPDFGLHDGDEADGLTALYTPGHAEDHLCFVYHVAGTGHVLFSGDHVMSWSSSIVNPPNGDMLDYYRSLQRLLERGEALYLPGHGPVLPQPRRLTAELLSHRQHREATILEHLQIRPWSIATLAEKLYAKTDWRLKFAAQRNVLAHMLKLKKEGLATELPPDDANAVEKELLTLDAEAKVEMESNPLEAKLVRADALRRFSFAPSPVAGVQ